MRTFGMLALVGLLPVTAHAAISINEIAWMGTTVSANAEWMELSNTGETPVDITGWRLVAGSGSPSITLAGTIAAHGYFLLERTSDGSVPTVTADQVYTGALTNSGTTLSLSDAAGASVDQVTGGDNWGNVGGDNATKQTAQRTSAGWVTATGTPRAVNEGESPAASSGTPAPAPTEAVATSTGMASSGPAEYLPIPVLRIITNGDRTVSSNADTAFTAAVYDSKGNRRDDAIVTWSFGDGMQRTGFNVFHSYYSPGEYVVVVHARTSDDGDALAESILTVKDAVIKIVGVSDRGITLANSSSRTLDLSFWRLSMGGQDFKIPADTQILAGRTVLFPLSVIGLPLTDSAALKYPSGEIAVAYPALSLPSHSSAVTAQPSLQPVSSNQVRKVEPITNAKRLNVQADEDGVIAPTAAVGAAAVGAAFPQDEPEKKAPSGIFRSPWTLSLLGVIALAGGAFILL